MKYLFPLDPLFTSSWIFVTCCACVFQFKVSAKNVSNGGDVFPKCCSCGCFNKSEKQ